MGSAYYSFCEELWRDWLADRLELPAFIRAEFDTGSAPEPWLPFGAGHSPLVALTTNPGASMPHQLRATILAGRSVVRPEMRYAEAAAALATFYEAELTGPARRRIAALEHLAMRAGYDGVVQVECCPFHSGRLPKKEALVRLIEAGGLLGTYVAQLRDFIATRPVIVVSAVSSRAPLSPESLRLSPWLAWQVYLMGLDLSRAELVPLVWKREATTSAALVDRGAPVPRALVLMMGGNHLPGETGLRRLAAALAPAGAQHAG